MVAARRTEYQGPSGVEDGESLELLSGDEPRRLSMLPTVTGLAALAGGHRLDVASLTPVEARLRWTGAAAAAPVGNLEIALEVGGERALDRIAAETRLDRGSGALVARFVDLPLSSARTIVGLLRHAGGVKPPPFTTEVVRGPRVNGVLNALLWSGAAGDLYDAGRRRARVTLLQLEGGSDPRLVWRVEGELVAPPFDVHLRGPWSVFSFRLRLQRRFGSLLVTDVPSSLARARRRVWRRLGEPVESSVRFAHPLWPELELRARVHDVSFGGMAFRADVEEMLLFPGLELPAVEIAGGPGAGLLVPARVCHAGGRNDDGHPVCGLSVEPSEAGGDWTNSVRERVYKHTTSGSTPFEALWGLYGDSGYLGIAGTRDARAESLAAPAATAVRSLDAAPDIAMNVVWPSRDGVAGALTVVRVYEHTWFGQHMAKRGGPTSDGWPSRLVLREMHLHAYEHALRDARARWFLGYVRHDAGWPKLVHVAFPRRATRTGEACVVPFRAFRVPTRGSVSASSGGRARSAPVLPPFESIDGVEIGPATDREIAQFATVVAQIRPRPYVEALDLVEDRMRMSGVSAAWARTGLMRERVILASRREGTTAAVGVFEATSDGVHVYDLLDCARLFSMAPGGRSTFGALLASARGWFAERGRPAFVLLAEEEPCPELALLGAVDMGSADATVTPRSLLPDLLEHMWEVTASPPVATM